MGLSHSKIFQYSTQWGCLTQKCINIQHNGAVSLKNLPIFNTTGLSHSKISQYSTQRGCLTRKFTNIQHNGAVSLENLPIFNTMGLSHSKIYQYSTQRRCLTRKFINIQHNGVVSLENLSTQVQPLIKICNTRRVVNFLILIGPVLFKVKIVIRLPI